MIIALCHILILYVDLTLHIYSMHQISVCSNIFQTSKCMFYFAGITHIFPANSKTGFQADAGIFIFSFYSPTFNFALLYVFFWRKEKG